MLLEIGKLYRSKYDDSGGWTEFTRILNSGIFMVVSATSGVDSALGASFMNEHYSLLFHERVVDLHLAQHVHYDNEAHVVQTYGAAQRGDLGTCLLSMDTYFFMFVPDTKGPLFELVNGNA